MKQVVATKINLLLYFMFVFASIMSLSSWDLFHNNLISFNASIVVITILLIILMGIFQSWTLKRAIVLLILTAFAMFYFHLYGNTYIISIILAVIAGMGMKFWNVIKIDFFSRLFSVLFVVGLSLISVLPKSGYGANLSDFHFTIYCYGFTYPNILGFQLVVLLMEFLILYVKKIKWWEIYLITVVTVVVEIELSYDTGIICIFIGIFTLATLRKKNSEFVNRLIKLSTFIMILLSFLSYYIAKNYNSTVEAWFKLNTVLSERPSIWRYYLSAMNVKMFGNMQTINQKTIGVVGFGAFDGAYIQFLLLFGIVGMVLIFILILILSYQKGRLEEKRAFLILLLPTIFGGFTETNGFLVTFGPIFFLIGTLLINPRDELTVDVDSKRLYLYR